MDLVEEGLLDKRDAILKDIPEHLNQVLHAAPQAGRCIDVESS